MEPNEKFNPAREISAAAQQTLLNRLRPAEIPELVKALNITLQHSVQRFNDEQAPSGLVLDAWQQTLELQELLLNLIEK